MSAASDLYFRKLSNLIGTLDIPELFRVVWQIRKMQTVGGRGPLLLYQIPDGFDTSDIRSNLYLHPWRLETLINCVLCRPQQHNDRRILQLRYLPAFLKLYDTLHKLENAQDGESLRRNHILVEIFRLTRRQFEWQRGFLNRTILYRCARIYHTELSKSWFHAQYGTSLELFSKTCFAVYALSGLNPAIMPSCDLTGIGIDNADRDAVFKIISADVSSAASDAKRMRSAYKHVAYAPSVLRSKPLIAAEGTLIAPLRELIPLRATKGLFYDFVENDQLREQFGRNFEGYVSEILTDHCAQYEVKNEVRYNGGRNVTPDVLLTTQNGVRVAFELKMRKMLARARFSENPVQSSIEDFSEVAKGFYQLWKYVEDSRSQSVPENVRAADSTHLVLVCMDEWLGMSEMIAGAVLEQAHAIADRKGLSKDPNVRRKVHFCLLDDLEYVLSLGDAADLTAVLDRASDERFAGWSISSIRDEVFRDAPPSREFGMACTDRIGQVLSWWEAFEADAKRRQADIVVDSIPN